MCTASGSLRFRFNSAVYMSISVTVSSGSSVSNCSTYHAQRGSHGLSASSSVLERGS